MGRVAINVFTAFCGLVLLLPLGMVQAAGPAASQQKLSRQIGRLILQLGADQESQRDAAANELLKLAGSTAEEVEVFLELLPAESEQMPVSIRDRLRRVRRQAEGRLMAAATSGTVVTLSAEDLAFVEIASAFEKQTGNRIATSRVRDGAHLQRRISINLVDEPFWPALDRVLDQASLSIYAYESANELAVISRGENESDRYSRASYSGPFRVELLEIQAQRCLREPRRDSLKLQLEVAWEPRLRPIALSQALSKIVATTGEDERLASIHSEAVLDVEVPTGIHASEIVLPFALPAREAKTIATLRGTLLALVPGRHVKFRFETLATAGSTSQRQGGTEVKLESARQSGELWELRMQFSLDDPEGALQSRRGWVFQNVSYLVDAEGKRIENVGFEMTRQTPNGVGIAYFFDLTDGLDGLAWVYETPAAIVELPVEYEIRDISLP